MEVLLELISVVSQVNHYKNTCKLDGDFADVFGDGEPIRIHQYTKGSKPHYDFDKNVNGTDSQLFEEYKNNPLCEPQLHSKKIFVVKFEDKITIKTYTYHLWRRIGEPFFRKATGYQSLTYNFKRNQLFNCRIGNYHKKKKFTKEVRCISPYVGANMFENYLNDLSHNYMTFGDGLLPRWFEVNSVMEVFYNAIADNIVNSVDFTEYIVTKQGFKLPNNFDVFVNQINGTYQGRIPTKADGKRNGFKFIDTLMGINVLKGDKLKRVLHKVERFNLGLYYNIASFFTTKFMLSRPDEELIKIFNTEINYQSLNTKVELTKHEKMNVYNIIIEMISGDYTDLYSISDHLNIKARLVKYEKVKWKSKTYDEFVDEHDEWSRNIESYTTGIVTRRHNKEFTNLIQKPFVIGGVRYYPIILTTTDEYNNESSVQTNCVRTYVQRAASVIISLRRGSKDSDERLTIEYNIFSDSNEFDVKLKRVQTKAKRNTTPDDTWLGANYELDNIIDEINNNRLFTLPEMDVIYRMGLPRHAKAIVKSFEVFSTVSWDDENVDPDTGDLYFPEYNDEVTQEEIDYLLSDNPPNYVTEDDELPL